MAHTTTRTLRARLFAVAALVALASIYLTPLVNADWNAWRYDHGHTSLTAVHAHAHPWQSSDGALADASAGEDYPGLVFTTSDDSSPGITAIWRSAPVEVTVALTLVRAGDPATPAPVEDLGAPASPPPRSALSHV